MLICSTQTDDAGTILLLGLSAKNIERLQKDQPIRVTRETHGLSVPADLKIFIIAGDTEAEMFQALKTAGVIGATTIVNQYKAQ